MGQFTAARLGRWLRAPTFVSLLAGSLVFGALFGLRQAGLLQFLELLSYDLLVRTYVPAATSERLSPATDSVVLIGVNEADIQALGRWPLPDSVLAEILELLLRYEPRAIGIDIYRDLPVPPGTEHLQSLLEQSARVVAVQKVGSEGESGVPAPPVLRTTERVGFNDVPLDPDGRVRRALLFLDDGVTLYYAFALRLALLYLAEEGVFPQPDEDDPQLLRLGSTTFRPLESNHGGYVGVDDAGYQLMVDYRRGRLPFPVYSYGALKSGGVSAADIRGKIVIIGVMAESVKDAFFTPYDTHQYGTYSGSASPGMPGPVVHAQVAAQLLSSALHDVAPLRSPSELQEALFLLVASLLGSLTGRWVRSAKTYALSAVAGPLVVAGLAYTAFASGWWLPIALPVVAWLTTMALATAYVVGCERSERRLLMQLFSKNVSPEIAEAIWRERDEVLAGGRLRPRLLVASVLFSDIKGFTPISEHLEPEELMEWLNGYMASMTRIVMEHGGVVDSFAGDGLKADFGVPVPRTDEESIRRDARNAVDCGLAMGAALKEINAALRRDGLPAVSIRVGVNSGPIVVGTLGSTDRLEYTSVGDAVNVASRLESLKDLPATPRQEVEKNDDTDGDNNSFCRLLVSSATLDHLAGEYDAEFCGNFTLKGKSQEMAVYQITGRSRAGGVGTDRSAGRV